jgi:hypothetical protein
MRIELEENSSHFSVGSYDKSILLARDEWLYVI